MIQANVYAIRVRIDRNMIVEDYNRGKNQIETITYDTITIKTNGKEIQGTHTRARKRRETHWLFTGKRMTVVQEFEEIIANYSEEKEMIDRKMPAISVATLNCSCNLQIKDEEPKLEETKITDIKEDYTRR